MCSLLASFIPCCGCYPAVWAANAALCVSSLYASRVSRAARRRLASATPGLVHTAARVSVGERVVALAVEERHGQVLVVTKPDIVPPTEQATCTCWTAARASSGAQ